MRARIIFALTIAVAINTFGAATLRYSGTVRDSSGGPAASIRVTFYPGHYWGAGDYTEVMTDANGRYEIIQQQKSPGCFGGPINLTNSIMARDFHRNLAAIQEFSGTTTNIDLILQPAITLSGTVKNTEGAPVNEAGVELRFLSGSSLVLLHPRPIKVDELGSFSIPTLPQGREYLIYGVTAKGYGSAFGRVETKNAQTNSYEFPTFVLKQADRKLAGQVVDGKGMPLAGVRVMFSGQGQPRNSTTNTDSAGNFFFGTVCEGPIKIFANYQEPEDPSIYMNLNGGGGMEAQVGNTNILIQLRDTSISDWDVPTLTTTGTVFDPSGKPAPSVSLAVWRSANPFKSVSSDINGKYRVRWQRPLGVEHDSASAKIKSVLIARDSTHNLIAAHELGETTANLDLRLRPGFTIGGVVQNSIGAAITNATVSINMWVNDAGAELAQTTTDKQGLFAINALPPEGEYTLDAKATTSDGQLLTGAFQVVGGDTNLILSLAFHEPGSIVAPPPLPRAH